MNNKNGMKVKQIIDEFRLPNTSVIYYIMEKGYEFTKQITEEDIKKEITEDVFIYTKEYQQKVVRCAIKICNECDFDEIFSYIKIYMDLYNAQTYDLRLCKGNFSECSWETMLEKLNLDTEEDVDDIMEIAIKAIPVTTYTYK